MKKPKKPYEPQKPVAPQKKIKVSQRIYFGEFLPHGKFVHSSKSIKLSEVLTRLPAGITPDDIYLCEESNYDYYSGDGEPYHYLEYYLEEDNVHYERQMKWHAKKKKEYERKLAKYRPLQEAYLKEKVIYDEWFKVHVKEREKSILENQVKLLKVQLTKLEKQKSKLEKIK